jgi:hypothetical protein
MTKAEEQLLAEIRVLRAEVSALHSARIGRMGWLRPVLKDLGTNPHTQYKVHLYGVIYWLANFPLVTLLFFLEPALWLKLGIFITLTMGQCPRRWPRSRTPRRKSPWKRTDHSWLDPAPGVTEHAERRVLAQFLGRLDERIVDKRPDPHRTGPATAGFIHALHVVAVYTDTQHGRLSAIPWHGSPHLH